MKYGEELSIFLISRMVPGYIYIYLYIRKILSDTTLVMLERTMFLATILLLVQYRFHNYCSDGKHRQ